jgi:hypothetical protein
MRASLKFITALLCFYFVATTAFAQNKRTYKKAFIGIWELSMAGTNGQPLQMAAPGCFKTFNVDKTFANFQVRNTGSVISHSGKYTIDDAHNYTETAMYRLENTGEPLGQGFKMNYGFSEDNKQVTFRFAIKNGTAFTEVWRKL